MEDQVYTYLSLIFSLIALAIVGVRAIKGNRNIEPSSQPDVDYETASLGLQRNLQGEPRNSNPYQLTVENKSAKPQKAILFGFNQFRNAPNYGSDIGIEITPSYCNSTYDELLAESAFCPFECDKIRLQTMNLDYIEKNSLVHVSKSAKGSMATYPIRISDYKQADANQKTIIDIEFRDYNHRVSGNNHIEAEIPANTKVVYTFFVRKQFHLSNLLSSDLATEYQSNLIDHSIFPDPEKEKELLESLK